MLLATIILLLFILPIITLFTATVGIQKKNIELLENQETFENNGGWEDE